MSDWIFGPDGKLILAGAIGGAAAALTQPGTFVENIRRVLVGAACAAYLSPLAIPFFGKALGIIDVDPTRAPGLSGFLVGAAGLILVEFIMAAARIRRRSLSHDDK